MAWPTRDEWVLIAIVVLIVYGARLVPLAGERIGRAIARGRGRERPDEDPPGPRDA